MLKFRRSNTTAPVTAATSSPQSQTNGAHQHHHTTVTLPKDVADGKRPQEASKLDRKCSFVSSQLGYSKSTVLLRNLSLPLAWPVEEYFGTKKDWREFIVQLGLRSKSDATSGSGSSSASYKFSKPIGNINRTYTDIDFPDEFIFADQGPDFSIELTVFCKRTDEGSTSVVQNISRSLGRSIGLSWRRYQQESQKSLANQNNKNAPPNRSFLEELRRAGLREEQRQKQSVKGNNISKQQLPSPFTIDENYLQNEWTLNDVNSTMMMNGEGGMQSIGIAHFCIRNATLSGKTHSYTLERLQNKDAFLSKDDLLPIYGNICAQILVQPNSLVSPLAQGSLDIFLSDSGILHQHLGCSLQGGQIRCWTLTKEEKANGQGGNSSSSSSSSPLFISQLISKKAPILCLPINQSIRLERTAFPTGFRLVFPPTDGNWINNDEGNTDEMDGQFLCICPTQRALIGWRNAIQLQQIDTEIWAEFAHSRSNPHAAALGILPGATPAPFFQPFLSPTDHQMSEDNLGNGQRPRASSSASMLKVPLDNANKPKVRMRNLKGNGDLLLPPGSAAAAAASPSPRITLIDADGTTTTAAIQQHKRTKGMTALSPMGGKHISWSLGHGPKKTTVSMASPTNVRTFFNQPQGNKNSNNNDNQSNQQPKTGSMKITKPPEEMNYNSNDGCGTAGEQQKHGGGGGTTTMSQQAKKSAIQRRTTEAMAPRISAGIGGTFVLSLNIGTNPTNEHQQQQKQSEAAAFAPSSSSKAKRDENDPSTIKTERSAPSSINNATSAKRPFNITLDFPSTEQQSRWARAQTGRSETWHFARTTQICTRL